LAQFSRGKKEISKEGKRGWTQKKKNSAEKEKIRNERKASGGTRAPCFGVCLGGSQIFLLLKKGVQEG